MYIDELYVNIFIGALVLLIIILVKIGNVKLEAPIEDDEIIGSSISNKIRLNENFDEKGTRLLEGYHRKRKIVCKYPLQYTYQRRGHTIHVYHTHIFLNIDINNDFKFLLIPETFITSCVLIPNFMKEKFKNLKKDMNLEYTELEDDNFSYSWDISTNNPELLKELLTTENCAKLDALNELKHGFATFNIRPTLKKYAVILKNGKLGLIIKNEVITQDCILAIIDTLVDLTEDLEKILS